MTALSEILESDPPRIEVEFASGSGGQEQFGWRMCGTGDMPLLKLVGELTQVQWLMREPSSQRCSKLSQSDPVKLVVVWHADTRTFASAVHPDVPVNSLIGFVELIKTVLVASQLHSQQHQRRPTNGGLFGPDGQLWRR